MITDQPTEVDAGAVILGSEGTQYSVELTIEDGEQDRTLLVFDGKVRVRGDQIDDEVESGRTWKQRRKVQSWGTIDETHLNRVSQRYAVFDASRMKPDSGESREAAVARFKKLHYQVLEKPEDSSKRGELAQEQLKIERTPQAYYHLRRGKITTD